MNTAQSPARPDLSSLIADPHGPVITTPYDPRLRKAGEWYAAQQNSVMPQTMKDMIIELGRIIQPEVDNMKVEIKFGSNGIFPPERESVCAWCQRPISQCTGCEPQEKPQRFSFEEFMCDWERDRTLYFDPRIMEPRGNYDTAAMLEARLILSVWHDARFHCGMRLGFNLTHETIIHQLTLQLPVAQQNPMVKLYATNGVFLPVVQSTFSDKRVPGLTKFVAERCPYLPENFYE